MRIESELEVGREGKKKISYLRDNQITIIERDSIDLDKAVMITQWRDLNCFVEFQTVKSAILAFNRPLWCGERGHVG